MGKIGQNPKIGQLWRPVATQPNVAQKSDRPWKLPGPWTTTWSKQYLSAMHPVTYSLLWVRCLFDLISISDFGGKWPLKWKFSKMSFRIPWRDIEVCFVTKFGENRPLRSCQKVAWLAKQKKLGLCGTPPRPHFGQNGPIASNFPWTLSPLDLSKYTEFGPDRLHFAGLITRHSLVRAKGEVFVLLYVCLFVNDFSTTGGPIHAKVRMLAYSSSGCVFSPFGG